MAYVVRVEVGKGKNRSVTQSIPLSKKRACAYIKRNPLVRSNTKVKVTNMKTGNTQTGTQGKFCNRFGKW